MPPAATAAATMSPVTIPVAAAAADAHDDSKSDPSVGPSAGKSDEDRAKDVLNSESKQSVVVPHALQLAAPDFNIVVCEAGCGDSRARVVYKQAKALMRSVANDPKLAYAPVTKNAECKGGCANDGGTRRGSAAEPAPKLLSPEAGNWLTKVAPSANASSPPASPVAAPTPEAPKPQAIAPQAIAPQSNTPQASTGAREDWLARINRERAEAKGQAPAIDAKAAPKS